MVQDLAAVVATLVQKGDKDKSVPITPVEKEKEEKDILEDGEIPGEEKDEAEMGVGESLKLPHKGE